VVKVIHQSNWITLFALLLVNFYIGTLVPSKDIDVSNNKHIYLPHHAVFKIDSLTTKLRVVFDGSVKSSNNLSLNDNLMGGPTLQKDLFHILVNFRIHRVVLCSDITKIYRQIFIDPAHRDFLRILWRNHADDPLQVFRLKACVYLSLKRSKKWIFDHVF
jgi:hypothetical protein